MKWYFLNFYDVTKHKFWVGYYILRVCFALIKRAIKHDLSKYSKEEFPYFVEVMPKFRKTKYGTEEYKQLLEEIRPALHHHYKNNQHHPEYWDGGIEFMSSLDLIEMLCDWKAASRRNGGNMKSSLKINKERFEINGVLFESLKRDLEELL